MVEFQPMVQSSMAAGAPAPDPNASVEWVEVRTTQSPDVSEGFRSVLGSVHDAIGRMKPAQDLMLIQQNDQVEAARASVLPSPYNLAGYSTSGMMGDGPVGGASVARGAQPMLGGDMEVASPMNEGGPLGKATQDIEQGVRVMQAGFEHALMVSLVTQVLGGLTNTTSTLIRQS